jgi:gamma-glutamyltranspeptidase / glutathione hydrolase
MRAHSGRTALVPGFMAGVQALHGRFGRSPFATLFGPAVWVADHGVAVSPSLANQISTQQEVLTRLRETKRIFTKADGKLYWYRDLFRQPELARTLAHVATEGSRYMYPG